jgi:recombination protein RecR
VSKEIGKAISDLTETLRRCRKCFNLSDKELCSICTSEKRSPQSICVVERPQDIDSIESTGEFKGTYHVLDGVISPLDGIGPDQLRIRELLMRLKDENINEILVATDPDTEGDATAMYLAQLIKPLGPKITRLAHGIAVGTELGYANRNTLACAVLNRREI